MASIRFKNAEEYATRAKLSIGSSFAVVVWRQVRKVEDGSSSSSSKATAPATDTNEAEIVFTVRSTAVRTGTGAVEEVPSVAACEGCGKEIGPPVNFGALQSHALHCSREDLHSCKICQKRFHRKSALDKHLFKDHGINRTNKAITCASCGKGFDKKHLLLKHLKRTKCGLKESAVGGKEQAATTGAIKLEDEGLGGFPETKTQDSSPSKRYSSKKDRTSGGECKPKAMVNHDGHIDWLLSCNTLMCSEEHRNHERKEDGREYAHGHECNRVDKRKRARTLSFGPLDVGGQYSNGAKAEESLQHCPLGCELAKVGCNHIEGARLVKHNDHWDHIIDDHLFHVFETEKGGLGMEDHGAFEILDSDLDYL